MKDFTKKDIATYTVSFIVLILFMYVISSIDKATLEKVATILGPWGPLFLVFILFCTHIFAPLSGTAFYLVGITLYGYTTTIILYYITCLLSSSVSFYIARRWGRNIVAKLVGKKTMHQIDDMFENQETKLLVVGRTLGYFFFDFISYALGLTTISFKKYFIYTATLTLIPMSVLYFVFKQFDFTSFKGMAIYYGSIFCVALIFSFLFTHSMKGKKE